MNPEIKSAMEAVINELRAHGSKLIAELIAAINAAQSFSKSVLRTAIWILVGDGAIQVTPNFVASIEPVA